MFINKTAFEFDMASGYSYQFPKCVSPNFESETHVTWLVDLQHRLMLYMIWHPDSGWCHVVLVTLTNLLFYHKINVIVKLKKHDL